MSAALSPLERGATSLAGVLGGSPAVRIVAANAVVSAAVAADELQSVLAIHGRVNAAGGCACGRPGLLTDPGDIATIQHSANGADFRRRGGEFHREHVAHMLRDHLTTPPAHP